MKYTIFPSEQNGRKENMLELVPWFQMDLEEVQDQKAFYPEKKVNNNLRVKSSHDNYIAPQDIQTVFSNLTLSQEFLKLHASCNAKVIICSLQFTIV